MRVFVSAIALAVFAEEAVVAEFETLPTVAIVASFESAIAAAIETSASVISELDNTPALLA